MNGNQIVNKFDAGGRKLSTISTAVTLAGICFAMCTTQKVISLM
jgi:hypothetical protein